MNVFVEKLVSQTELAGKKTVLVSLEDGRAASMAWEPRDLGSALLQRLHRLGSLETVVQVRLWAALDGRKVPQMWRHGGEERGQVAVQQRGWRLPCSCRKSCVTQERCVRFQRLSHS